MSMNLIFVRKDRKGYEEFPFQTPTDLTYAVLNEPDTEKRIFMLEEHMRYWDDDIKERCLEEIKALIHDHDFELVAI